MASQQERQRTAATIHARGLFFASDLKKGRLLTLVFWLLSNRQRAKTCLLEVWTSLLGESSGHVSPQPLKQGLHVSSMQLLLLRMSGAIPRKEITWDDPTV